VRAIPPKSSLYAGSWPEMAAEARLGSIHGIVSALSQTLLTNGPRGLLVVLLCAWGRQIHHFETLTPREREVMALVVTGRLNKQIAADLGVSEITVKVHRGQVMRKMRASSLPDLARMADQLQLTPTKPHSPGRVA
jgi:DNA-binding NarL/FixJ family response regulator